MRGLHETSGKVPRASGDKPTVATHMIRHVPSSPRQRG
ncbi:hypothetical protein [Escherichia coli IS1]|nr:hypothetical protein AB14_3649 [Escherichia coli 1-392-07_S1_C1]CDK48170.1 hypothetical protein [Escherichia coli IS1]